MRDGTSFLPPKMKGNEFEKEVAAWTAGYPTLPLECNNEIIVNTNTLRAESLSVLAGVICMCSKLSLALTLVR